MTDSHKHTDEKKVKCVTIGQRTVGPGEPCYVIAEIGVNHDGDANRAKEMIHAAAAAGADAVKFQSFTTKRLLSGNLPKVAYIEEHQSESIDAMFRRLELPRETFALLAQEAAVAGVDFFSSPFDADWVDFLVALGVPAIKVASGEITNVPLLEHMATKGLPLILSTGMSEMVEVENACGWIWDQGCEDLVVLQCTSNYPAAIKDANLRTIATLRNTLGCPVGFSDHTTGPMAAVVAVSLGACVLEKHFTLDVGMQGPDHAASADPDTFQKMVQDIRHTETLLGSGVKAATSDEQEIKKFARRSVVAARDLKAGTILVLSDLDVKRPDTGISPGRITELVGRRLTLDLAGDTLLNLDYLE